jgi:transcriptional regulator with XRE-family HTH domain
VTGAELRALRLRLGYSLTKLAEVTGVSVSTVCRYQSGDQVIPKAYALAVMSLPKVKGSR